MQPDPPAAGSQATHSSSQVAESDALAQQNCSAAECEPKILERVWRQRPNPVISHFLWKSEPRQHSGGDKKWTHLHPIDAYEIIDYLALCNRADGERY